MYLSPSPNRGTYLNLTEQNLMTDDYYSNSPHNQYTNSSSNSKKLDKKRKAQSINEIIKKVEKEISMNSEMGTNSFISDSKSKSHQHSCTNSFTSVLNLQQQQQQQQQQHLQQQFQHNVQSPYMSSHSPRQQSLSMNQQKYYQSPQQQPQQQNNIFTPQQMKTHQNKSIDFINQTNDSYLQDSSNAHHHNHSHNHNYNSNSMNNIINNNNLCRTQSTQSATTATGTTNLSGTRQSIFPQNSTHSSQFNSYSNNNITPIAQQQQYVTMRDFRSILEEQLLQREQSIIQQVSSCLKEQIIPEIKRQVVKELDKKKIEIDNLIQNFHSSVQSNSQMYYLDEKISNLKMSFDRSKFTKSQAELKAQTLDQKYHYLEERINRIEEQSLEQINIFEHYKSDNTQIITDFKNAQRQWSKMDEMLETLSRTVIGIEYTVKKNNEDIIRKINSIETTEEVPFNIQKDKYSEGLIRELKKQLPSLHQHQQNKHQQQFDDNSGEISSNQTDRLSEIQEKQEPYQNIYQLNVNLKNIDHNNSGQKNNDNLYNNSKNNNMLVESFGDYDISPTLKSSQKKKIVNQLTKGLSPSPNSNINSNNNNNNNNQQGLKIIEMSFNQIKKKSENGNDNDDNDSQNDYNYDYDYNKKIREVDISDRNRRQLQGISQQLNFDEEQIKIKECDQSQNNQQQQQQLQSIKEQEQNEENQEEQQNNYDEIPNDTQQSVDINYIKKGLPQIFPFVESTNYAIFDNVSSSQLQSNSNQIQILQNNNDIIDYNNQDQENNNVIRTQKVLCSDFKFINKNELFCSEDDPIKLSEIDQNKMNNNNQSGEKDRYQNSFFIANQIQSVNIDQLNHSLIKKDSQQLLQLQENNNVNQLSSKKQSKISSDENNIQKSNVSSIRPPSTLSHCLKKSDKDQNSSLDLGGIISHKSRIMAESDNLEELIQNRIDIHPNFSITDSQF